EAGGSLIDTSATYGGGAAESVIGTMLQGSVDRQDLLLCSKAGVRTDAAGSRPDTSRGALLDSLDASLARLGTDHLDLWLVQAPDGQTPLRETVSALRQAVASGRTRYVGLSNYPAWQLAWAVTWLESDETFLTAAQMEYSLLQRGIERDLVPAAQDCGVGVLAWSPLGR